MNKSGIILLIGAIIIAIAFTVLNTYWLSFKGLQLTQKIKKIDYYLSDFTLLATQPDGKMRYHVQAQHLVHQQTTGASEIFQPTFKAQDENEELITLKANKAEQLTKNGEIKLKGDVIVFKDTTEKTKGFNLATEDLTYNPLQRSIATDAKITLESGANHLQGIGLSGKLDEQELRIHSNVHAKFMPSFTNPSSTNPSSTNTSTFPSATPSTATIPAN